MSDRTLLCIADDVAVLQRMAELAEDAETTEERDELIAQIVALLPESAAELAGKIDGYVGFRMWLKSRQEMLQGLARQFQAAATICGKTIRALDERLLIACDTLGTYRLEGERYLARWQKNSQPSVRLDGLDCDVSDLPSKAPGLMTLAEMDDLVNAGLAEWSIKLDTAACWSAAEGAGVIQMPVARDILVETGRHIRTGVMKGGK